MGAGSFNQPAGMTFSPYVRPFNTPPPGPVVTTNDLYYADQIDNVIRKINSQDGVISTVAGPGVGGMYAVTLNAPTSLLAWKGFVYISDTGNHRIRKLDLSTGVIFDVAGNGVAGLSGDGGLGRMAQLNSPGQIAFDPVGNLFIADRGNNRIRRVDIQGNISTYAGNVLPGLGPDFVIGTPAVFGDLSGLSWNTDRGSQQLQISEGTSNRIRQIQYAPTITTLTQAGSFLNANVAPQYGPAASGRVSFFMGQFGGPFPTLLGSQILGYGQASIPFTANVTGALWAVYEGNSGIAPSASVPIGLPTAITLYSSFFPPLSGQTVTLSGSVSPSAATGTVSLWESKLEGLQLLGSVNLTNGAYSLILNNVAAGNHGYAVTYPGDGLYAPSRQGVSQLVTISPGISATASPNPAIASQSVTITATLNPAATGAVTFTDGAATLGTAVVANGTASFTISAISAGLHNLYVSYGGDTTYFAQGAGISESVKAASVVNVTSSVTPSNLGQTVVITATIAPATATGSIQFFEGTTVLATAAVTNGAASFSTANLTQGSHSLSAVYSGDANDTSATGVLTQMVKQAGGLTTVDYPATVTAGNPLTFTATTNATATGTITFTEGASTLATVPVVNAVATYSTTTLAPGVHNITVFYSGDSTFSSSSININPITVLVATSIAATSSVNPALTGQAITFTASVIPATATGTVQFFDGATSLGTVTLAGGQAALSISSLTAGAHSITAVYSGNATTASSTTASAITQTVKAATAVTLASSVNPSTVDQSVTLAAAVSPATATGTVQFLDGATVIGTATLAAGQASFTTTTLTAGIHTITASYSGDAAYGTSTAASAISQTVRTAAVITLASTFNPAQVGITFGLNTTITPSSATGTVQLLDGTTVLATMAVTAGSANFSIGTLSLGTHALSAVYSGDANNSPATATLSQEVKQSPGLIPQATPNPAVAGQAVTISGKVNTAATGTLTIKEGAATLATVAIANGIGSFTTSSLTPGVHSLNLIYNGDATYLGGQSPIDVTILNATTIAVGTSVNPATAGQGITFTASVTPATAAGTVQFFDGATSLGTVTLAGGQAALSTSTLTAGSHSITASYSGNATNAPATTTTAIAQVVKAVGAVTLTTSVNPSTVGQSVALTAVVTPSTATGTVQFKEGATVLGTAAVTAGSASLALTTLAQGAHSITAVYSGDANTVGATSATITQTVNPAAPGAPSSLVATASGSATIDLTWAASATAGVTYNVYASSASGFTPSAANRIATGVAGTSYSATGLNSATAYYFKVTALNAGGESAATNQANATTTGAFACHVTYTVTSQNSTRFDGAFTIKNTGTLATTSWKLTWTWAGNQVVTQSSNATYKQTGNSVTFSSSGNGTINPGGTVSGMTLRANYSGTNTAPTVFSVNGTVCQ